MARRRRAHSCNHRLRTARHVDYAQLRPLAGLSPQKRNPLPIRRPHRAEITGGRALSSWRADPAVRGHNVNVKICLGFAVPDECHLLTVR